MSKFFMLFPAVAMLLGIAFVVCYMFGDTNAIAAIAHFNAFLKAFEANSFIIAADNLVSVVEHIVAMVAAAF